MKTNNEPSESLEVHYIRDCLAFALGIDGLFPFPPDQLNWDVLYAELNRQRLGAFFSALEKQQKAKWPASFSTQLLKDRYSLQIHNSQCADLARKMLAKFKDNNIPTIVLKGWAFIGSVYAGDVSVRVCEDIDVLVHPEHTGEAEQILLDLGCQPAAESWPDYTRRYNNARAYFFHGLLNNSFSVGLHWGVTHFPSYDPAQVRADALFRRSIPVNVANVPVLDLSIEDQIVYSCMHLCWHHRLDPSLFRYYELAFLIKNNTMQINWELVIEYARQWECVLPVYSVLSNISVLWAGVIPEDTLMEIRQIKSGYKERFLMKWVQVFNKHYEFDHLLTWFTFPIWQERGLLMLKDIFPGPNYLRERYGEPPLGIWPLLYLVRVVHAIYRLFDRNLQS